MKVLLVNSGIPGFPYRYAHDLYQTLTKDFKYTVHHTSPQFLSKKSICEFKPDIMLVIHGTHTPSKLVRYASGHGITTILWLVEDPYEIDYHRGEMVESYDYVFTNERQAVKEYRLSNVFYLPWCCNPYVHKRVSVPPQYKSDLCFVGMGFPNRLKIINKIAGVLKDLNVKLIGDWESWGVLHPALKDKVFPVIEDFREVRKYYNGAKINLNIHRNPYNPPSGNSKKVGATSPNDRVFALAGCGAFQLVDNTRPDLHECFSEGREIVTFNTPEDLGEKILKYLGKEELRRLIGEAAEKRAYKEHTYKHRLARIFQTVGWQRKAQMSRFAGVKLSGLSSSILLSPYQGH